MATAETIPRRSDAQLMTSEGYERLRRELRSLMERGRWEIAERFRHARADGGDPAENGELLDAMQDSQRLERRIGDIAVRLSVARVAEPGRHDGVAGVGTIVRLRNQIEGVLEYHLVGDGEADPSRGRISVTSPVGQAVSGCRVGEEVEVETPKQNLRFEILAVDTSGDDAGLAQAA